MTTEELTALVSEGELALTELVRAYESLVSRYGLHERGDR